MRPYGACSSGRPMWISAAGEDCKLRGRSGQKHAVLLSVFVLDRVVHKSRAWQNLAFNIEAGMLKQQEPDHAAVHAVDHV